MSFVFPQEDGSIRIKVFDLAYPDKDYATRPSTSDTRIINTKE